MAKKDDRDTQFNPKHRIVGVIIIVSLAVIFVPMILQQNPGGIADGELRISKIPDKNTKVYVAKVDTPKLAGSQIKPSTDTTIALSAKKHSNTKLVTLPELGTSITIKEPAIKPSTDNTKKSKTVVVKESDTAKKTANRGWLIQVGTFANKTNADRVSRRLRQAGFKVKIANIELENKTAVRIRVGPFSKKQTATKSLARVNRVVGVKGIVIAQP